MRDQEEEYVVETIIREKRQKQRNGRIKVLYLVKWQGYDDQTWEPAEHLVNCKKKLDDFRREKLEVFRKNRQKTHQVVKEGEQKDGEEEDNEVADEEDEQKSQADDEEEDNQAAEVHDRRDEHEEEKNPNVN